MEPAAAGAGSATRPPRRRRHLGLRVTLVSVVTGLLIMTVLGFSAVSFWTFNRAADEFVEAQLRAVAAGVGAQVHAQLEAATLTVRDLDLRAEQGRLPLGAPDRLLTFLVDRLRFESTLNRLSYSDLVRDVTLFAWRDSDRDAQIVAGRIRPRPDGGRGSALDLWVAREDGTRIPIVSRTVTLTTRETQAAKAAEGVPDGHWVGPVQSADRRGLVMIVVTNVRRPGVPQSLGVFSATFLVRGLQDILDRATSDRPGVQAALLNPDGGIVASTHPGIGDRVPALAAALPAPLAKLPLDVSIPLSFAHAGVAYDGGLHAFRLGHGGHWVLAFFLPETTVYAAAYRGRRLAAVMGLAVLALGVVLGTLVAARIAGPLRTIAADLAQIARFRLSSIPSPQSFVREVAVVADSVDRMKAGLRSFAHYVPTDLVRALLERGAEAELGGETRVLTFHFSDIENFTTLSEHLAPDEVVQTLAEYLECMMDVIRAQGGTVKDFFGDGIMAFWNAPNPVPDHAARACRAALRARADLGALHARWAAAGKPVYRARIGLHTGAALVGNFGTRERFAFAAVGDKVNLASRLEGLNKVYGTYILASESTQAAAGGGLEWRTLDRVAVAGRTGSTLVCELLGEQGQVRADVLEARDRYEEALAAYFARQFPEAAKGFAAVTALRHHDRAAQTMAGRAEMYALSPPPPDWVGVHVQTMK